MAPAAVDEAILADLKTRFAPVSAGTLRKALAESGIPSTPLVEGVRQDTLENLERTLLALEVEYSAGNPEHRRRVRGAVLTARTHAEWAQRRRPEKTETVLWLQVWLQNPPLFPSWVELRRRQLATEAQSTQPE